MFFKFWMIFISIYERFSIKYFNFFKFELAKCTLHWKRIEFENKIVGLLQYQAVFLSYSFNAFQSLRRDFFLDKFANIMNKLVKKSIDNTSLGVLDFQIPPFQNVYNLSIVCSSENFPFWLLFFIILLRSVYSRILSFQ